MSSHQQSRLWMNFVSFGCLVPWIVDLKKSAAPHFLVSLCIPEEILDEIEV